MKELKQKIEKEVELGNVSKRKHPRFPLYIYNYTPECQFDKKWNDINIQCRGLVLDEQYAIVIRCLPKFFNIEELELLNIKIPNLQYRIEEKKDGSLFLVTKWNNQLITCTRGSFESWQAIDATKIIQEKYTRYKFKEGYSYLFEYIAPINRIVVDYGNERDLYLLTIIKNKNGKELNLNTRKRPFKRVKTFHYNYPFKKLQELNYGNEEGFVIKFENGFRFKLKFERYVYLHRIVTGFSAKRIWESLKEGLDIEEIKRVAPEEFLEWMNNHIEKFTSEYEKIENDVKKIVNSIKKMKLETRKEIALQIQKRCDKKHLSIAFNMLDEKDYKKMIWKLLEPKGEEIFKRD